MLRKSACRREQVDEGGNLITGVAVKRTGRSEQEWLRRCSF